MSDFLKGNYDVDKEIKDDNKDAERGSKLQQEFKKKILNSIGGSMVYVDKTDLAWDPEAEDEEKK